jgi:hypothetical protein
VTVPQPRSAGGAGHSVASPRVTERASVSFFASVVDRHRAAIPGHNSAGGPCESRSRHLGIKSAFSDVALGPVLPLAVPFARVKPGVPKNGGDVVHRAATQDDGIVGSSVGQNSPCCHRHPDFAMTSMRPSPTRHFEGMDAGTRHVHPGRHPDGPRRGGAQGPGAQRGANDYVTAPQARQAGPRAATRHRAWRGLPVRRSRIGRRTRPAIRRRRADRRLNPACTAASSATVAGFAHIGATTANQLLGAHIFTMDLTTGSSAHLIRASSGVAQRNSPAVPRRYPDPRTVRMTSWPSFLRTWRTQTSTTLESPSKSRPQISPSSCPRDNTCPG